MKKIIISGIIFIVLGFIIGDTIFNNRLSILKDRGETYYFLQEGIYSEKDILETNLSKLSQKVIDYDNNKFYVYVGITKDNEVAEKIKNIYEEKGFKIIKKEKNIFNEEFSNNVNQFDLLIKASSSNDEVLTIEEVVLSNYEELITEN